MSAKIFLVAAESSGDQLGADLIGALKAKDPGLRFAAVGGPGMAQAGAQSLFDIHDLAILGLIDGVKAYARVIARADQTAAAILAEKPAAVVLIDSWGFTLRVAQRVRAAAPEIKLIKYIGPQVWASRPGRARTLAATVDHLICIHDFEVPFYTSYGLSCTVCGHPAISRFAPGDGASFRARHGIAADAPFALILPGSRRAELRRTGPILMAAADRLRSDCPGTELRLLVAGPVRDEARALAAAHGVSAIDEDGEKENAFAAATVALACSGTVTTEVGLQRTPVVVGYKLGWITWALARAFLYNAPFITLMNVAVGAEIAPEFIQTEFTPAAVAGVAMPLLCDPAARAAQVAAQDEALARMGKGGPRAAEIAAEAVLRQIGR
ncbi:MAG: lipid-A-disaccharide synthase [Caulobacterales bacterium]